MFKRDRPAILGGTPIFNGTLPILKPSLPDSDDLLVALKNVISTGQITNSRYVREFEEKTTDCLEIKNCVAVSSCTSGLMLAVKAMGLTGEVILPSFTFSATGHSLLWNGITPVFADCVKDTYNIDPKSVENKITRKTSAILAVHIFGNPADADSLSKIAKRNNLKLVFDAAHAFGSCHNGIKVGNFGDVEVFSLSPTKLLISGEGGLVTTENDELAEKIRIGRNYGNPGNYNCEFAGLSARMTEWNAVLAIKMLEFLEENIERRNYIANLFRHRLETLPGISFQHVKLEDKTTWKDYSIIIDSEEFGMHRDILSLALEKENIKTKKYFDPPMHKMKVYEKYFNKAETKMLVTEYISNNIITLPIYYSLSDNDVENILSAIERIQSFSSKIRMVSGKP